MSPLALVSAGIAMVCSVSVPRGAVFAHRPLLRAGPRAMFAKPRRAGPYLGVPRPAAPSPSAGRHGLRRYRRDHPPARARGRRRDPRGLRPRRLRGPREVRRLAGHRGGRARRRASSPAASRRPSPRSRSSPRSRPTSHGLAGAGLLPRRPARRHQGVRAAPRRLHRQHRADRERRADPRRRLRPGAGPAVLHRRRRPLAGGGRAARRRRAGALTPLARRRRPTRPALVVVASKSHRDQATDDYIAPLPRSPTSARPARR